MTVASDNKDVEHTLIRFVYEIGLSSDGKTFEMLLNYVTSPINPKSFSGNIHDLVIRPSSKEVYVAWAKADYTGPLRKSADQFSVHLNLPKEYRLEQQEYVIFDKNGKIAGEIPAPFLSSGSSDKQ